MQQATRLIYPFETKLVVFKRFLLCVAAGGSPLRTCADAAGSCAGVPRPWRDFLRRGNGQAAEADFSFAATLPCPSVLRLA